MLRNVHHLCSIDRLPSGWGRNWAFSVVIGTRRTELALGERRRLQGDAVSVMLMTENLANVPNPGAHIWMFSVSSVKESFSGPGTTFILSTWPRGTCKPWNSSSETTPTRSGRTTSAPGSHTLFWMWSRNIVDRKSRNFVLFRNSYWNILFLYFLLT